MITHKLSKKILIAIFQLCTFSIHALQSGTPVPETIDTNAIFGKAKAVLIDSSWILAGNNAPIIHLFKKNIATINNKEYHIKKIIPLSFFLTTGQEYQLIHLEQPIINIKPINRVRFLPEGNQPIIVVGRYQNKNVSISKTLKISNFSINNIQGFAQTDIGDPIFWKSEDSTNYGLVGFLDNKSKISPLTQELNTQIDNEIIKQALSGTELIKIEEEETKLEEEQPQTPRSSPRNKQVEKTKTAEEPTKSTTTPSNEQQTPRLNSPNKTRSTGPKNRRLPSKFTLRNLQFSQPSTEKMVIDFPGSIGSKITLIDSSWMLTLKTDQSYIDQVVKLSDKKDSAQIDKVIDHPELPFQLLHLDQPLFSHPIKRLRTEDSFTEKNFTVLGESTLNSKPDLLSLGGAIHAAKFVLTSLEQEELGFKTTSGSGLFLTDENHEYELAGIAEDKGKETVFHWINLEINTWIDNEIIKQALINTQLIEKEEGHPQTPPSSSTTSKSEYEEKSTEKKELILPKAVGYNTTLIDSNWILTFKSKEIDTKESTFENASIDAVIDNPDAPFRLLHLNKPILDQPIKRARFVASELQGRDLISIDALKEPIEMKIFSSHEFHLTEAYKGSTGAGAFIQSGKEEVELIGVTEDIGKKTRIYLLDQKVNTWIDNKIIKQALTAVLVPTKPIVETHPEIPPISVPPTEISTSTEETHFENEIQHVLNELDLSFERVNIANPSKFSTKLDVLGNWKKLVNAKKEELKKITTNEELVSTLNEWVTKLKKELDIERYLLEITAVKPVASLTVQKPAEWLTESYQTKTTTGKGKKKKTTTIQHLCYRLVLSNLDEKEANQKVQEAIDTISKTKTNQKPLIIDLRDASGKNIRSLSKILGYFLGSEVVIASYFDRSGKQQTIKTASSTLKNIKTYFTKQLIVLVSDQTSGTAEIMAQDLQENANAIIIGTHTADKVDMTGTTEITGLDHRSIWFTYPLIDFLSSNGLPLQQLGGVQFGAQNILLKANEDALNRAIKYLKTGK